MRKLLIICGPTATGKTSLGLNLSKKFKGEILSADSRQVYTNLNVGTGKDIPSNFKLQHSTLTYREKKLAYYGNGTKIWGYDLASPGEEFNLSIFTNISRVILSDIWKRNKLPIAVGGTGLYMRSLTQNLSNINIPPDKKLRLELEKKTIDELQRGLKELNHEKFNKLNNSDKNNPRRLIRAIEIEKQKKNKSLLFPSKNNTLNKPDSVLWIGLKTSNKDLKQRIGQRVKRRFQKGMTDEVRSLIQKGFEFSLPSFSALGYREWKDYLMGKKSQEEALNSWKTKELAYAKRQMTWFSKNKRINWFDIERNGYKKRVVHLISQWYSES